MKPHILSVRSLLCILLLLGGVHRLEAQKLTMNQLPGQLLAKCRDALQGNRSWIVQRPADGAVLQLLALRGANDYDRGEHQLPFGAVVGVIREMGNSDAVMEKGPNGWTIPRGEAVCVVVTRANANDRQGWAQAYLLTQDGSVSKPLGASPMTLVDDKHHNEAYACWTGRPDDKGCPDRSKFEKLLTEEASRGLQGSELEAAVVKRWAIEVEGGPWFSCAKDGCCRL